LGDVHPHLAQHQVGQIALVADVGIIPHFGQRVQQIGRVLDLHHVPFGRQLFQLPPDALQGAAVQVLILLEIPAQVRFLEPPALRGEPRPPVGQRDDAFILAEHFG